ncbi:MAG: DUF881 domain-containing protein [Eubacteriales bacterium]|nr:DUF881 domain-containing protein [Eubacteriales bacterium]
MTNHITQVNQLQPSNNLSKIYQKRQEELEQAILQYDSLTAENKRLLIEKETVIENQLNQKGYSNLLDELNKVKTLAGLTRVQGPGISVILNDKPSFDVLRDSADALVHDSDVRHVLDLLRASGAAALSVNDQRIVNASYVFCIGPTILCNMQRLTPPYIIQAIGQPTALASAIERDPMLSLRQSSEIGLIVQVKQLELVICPAYAEADDLNKYIDKLVVPVT